MRLVATACLAGATLLFFLGRFFEDRHGLFFYLRIFGEAAMVGGLADWFAVTALFRHPLGIPIPHTAIIPRRKNEIGRQLGEFIRDRFFTPHNPLLIETIRSFKIVYRGTEWLVKKENTEFIVRRLSHMLGRTLSVMRDEDFSKFLNDHITDYIRRNPIAPHLANLLSVLRVENRHQQLIDEGLRVADELIQKNIPLIKKLIEEGTPWWTFGLADKRIFNAFITKVSEFLSSVTSDPHHPMRMEFEAYYKQLIYDLRNSQQTIDKVERFKNQILDNPKMQDMFSKIWPGLKTMLVQICQKEDSELHSYVENLIVDTIVLFRSDSNTMKQLNDAVEDFIVQLIGRDGKDGISNFISETVASWDTETTTRQVELLMGDDLQFVRINGTVVGGLAGLAIYGLSMLLEKVF